MKYNKKGEKRTIKPQKMNNHSQTQIQSQYQAASRMQANELLNMKNHSLNMK